MSKLVKVEVGRFDYDFVGEFKFFKPGIDGKTRRPSVLVRLTDDDGFQGWGQAVPTPTWTYETPEPFFIPLFLVTIYKTYGFGLHIIENAK